MHDGKRLILRIVIFECVSAGSAPKRVHDGNSFLIIKLSAFLAGFQSNCYVH